MLIQKELEITIDGKGLYNITEIINQAIAKHRIAKGLCTLFIKHTSASLVIQENADPNVLKDILDFFRIFMIIRNGTLEYYLKKEYFDG